MFVVGYEWFVYGYDEIIGLNVLIFIYLIVCGFVVGGCCMFDYVMFEDVVCDVECLLWGMIYKNVGVDLLLGGGKFVIIGVLDKVKFFDFMWVFGIFVDMIVGDYYIVEDVGILF